MAVFFIPTQTVFGPGCLAEIGTYARREGFRHALVVTDPGIRAAGLLEGVEASLAEAELAYSVYDNVTPNPTVPEVHAGARVYRESGADLIVAVGGGSAMDAAKGIAVEVAEDADIREYFVGAGNRLPERMAPLYCVPTTVGTGSEISRGAVITDVETHYKQVVVGVPARMAFLDPQMVAKLPAPITAATGMDALTHAVEAFINPGHTPYTQGFAVQGIRLIGKHLRRAVNGPDRAPALAEMQMAANIAGASMAMGLGHVHGTSHCISARLGTAHGVANAIMLTAVLDYHRDAIPQDLAEVGALLGLNTFGVPAPKAAADTIAAIGELRAAIGVPDNLRAVGADAGILDQLSDDVMASQVRFLGSPRPASKEDIRAMYAAAL